MTITLHFGILKIDFFFFFEVCVCVTVCLLCVEVEDNLAQLFFLPPHGFQGLKSGWWDWWQTSLPA